MPECDADGDGYPSVACGGADCDDGDAEVHPGGWDTNATRGTWSTEFVFGQIGGDTRGKTSLALERNGVAHVSEASRGLRHATNLHGNWESQLVDERALGAPSLVLSAAGRPRIAYLVDHEVWLVTLDAGGWALQRARELPLARAPWELGAAVLAIDADDRLHLTFTAEDGKLRYATSSDSGVSWSLEASPSTPEVRALALVVDADRVPHFLYSTDESQGALFYATRCGRELCISHIAEGSQMAADLALDASGSAHVVHGLATVGSLLTHSTLTREGKWQSERLAPPSCWSVALEARGGTPLLHAVCAPYMESIQIGELGRDGWSFQSAGEGNGVSLAVEGSAVRHITFTDFRFGIDTFVSYATERRVALDGIDSDCDGADGVDSDGDGDASLHSGGTDCDDHDPSMNGAANDPVGDFRDANCDGVDG